MPNLTGSISFTVEFNFTGTPAIILTPSSTIPDADKANLIGHFTVTQPDGLPIVGTSGEVTWDGSEFTEITAPLTLASDYTYQKGTYTIEFFAACTGYVYGTFSRSWDMEYEPVTLTLEDGFDLFTPELTYIDTTVYGVGDYSITNDTSLWEASSAAGDISGASTSLDLSIGGEYYDSTYIINYTKTIDYLHDSYSWLTVKEELSKTVTKKAFIPASMATLLTYLVAIKDERDAAIANCQTYDDLDEVFEDANSLYQLMRVRVCAQNTTGLAATFAEFYAVTHNYQPQIYINTNTVIPTYDFTTGCNGGVAGSGRETYPAYYTASTDNEDVITLSLPVGAIMSTVAKGVNALLPAYWSYIEPTLYLTGVALAEGESLYMTYKV